MTEDCRKLSPEQQEEIRRRAVSMVQKGTPPQERTYSVSLRVASFIGWLVIVVEGGTVCKLARAAVVLRSWEKPT